ncbi:hypothetical protein AB0425_36265 [Actinosynnema sp. NPDC051121]
MNEGAPGRPSAHDRYDVDHPAKVATGHEVRERVDQEYRERFGPFGAYVAHLLSPGKVDDLLDAQAAQLRGQVMTRSAPPEPGVDYLGITHQELHDGVHVGGDPGIVGEHGDLWTQLGNELVEFNDAIVKAIADSEPDWTGKAGDQARQAMAGLAQKAGETAVAAQLAGTLFAQQSRALSTARANVPPPPAEPFDVDAANRRLMTTTDPVALVMRAAADRAEFLRQQEEHRQAADAVEKYDRTVAQTAAAQPAFAPPPAAPVPPAAPTPPEGRPTPVAPGQVPGGRAAVPDAGDATDPASATSDTGGTTGAGTTNASGTGTPAPGGVGGTGGLGVTGTSGLAGVPGPGRVGSGGGDGPDRGAGSGGGAGFGGAAGFGGGTGSGRGAGTGGGAKPGAGFGGLGGARGQVGGVPGSESRGGPGSAVRGLGGAGGTHGEGVGRGGRPAGAGPGVAGGPVGGPAAGRGEEDVEHQSPSYLLEPDPEALFGNGEATAPPVIGDWSDHD